MGNFLGIKQGDKIRMYIGEWRCGEFIVLEVEIIEDHLNAFIYECESEPGKSNPQWRKIINGKHITWEKI